MIRLLLALALALLVGIGQSRAESTPTVALKFSLLEINLPKESSDVFQARFLVTFSWDQAQLPNFDPKRLAWANAQGQVKQEQVQPRVGPISGLYTEAYVVSGRFKGSFDFQDYPFDTHDLPLALIDPQASEGAYRFTGAAADLDRQPAYNADFGGWRVSSIELYDNGKSSIHPLPVNAAGKPAVFAGILVDVHRGALFSIVRFFIPICIIWLMSYMGLFWDDSSPASRCGTAAIFAAIAFAIGTNAVIPNVDYLTVMNVLFLGTYVNIGICFLLVTWMFWLKGRNQKAEMKRVWTIGVVACPLIALLTIAFCVSLSGTRGETKSFEGTPAVEKEFRG